MTKPPRAAGLVEKTEFNTGDFYFNPNQDKNLLLEEIKIMKLCLWIFASL